MERHPFIMQSQSQIKWKEEVDNLKWYVEIRLQNTELIQ